MAINLWETAGLPVVYDFATTTALTLNNIRSSKYIVRLKAKSATGQRIYFQVGVGSEYFNSTYLTSDFQTIEREIPMFLSSSMIIGSHPTNTIHDIVVEDIELVEKPMAVVKQPKKNLIKPFTEWTLHANARIINPYEFELNATGGGLISEIYVPVLPEQSYLFSFSGSGYCWLQKVTKTKSAIGLVLVDKTQGSHEFVTDANTAFMRVILYNWSQIGTFTFKNPMLTLGTTPQPFEPYVEVNPPAVNKVPKKNMFDPSFDFSKWSTVNVTNLVNADGSMKITNNNYNTPRAASPSLKREWGGKTVVISVDILEISNNQAYRLSVYDSKVSAYVVNVGFSTTGRKEVSLTLPIDCSGCQFWIHPSSIISTEFLVAKDIQLEEGTTATPFEPYKEVNKRTTKLIPKKNIFDTNIESGYYGPGTGSPVPSPSHKRNINFMVVSPSNVYQLNKNTNNNFYVHYFNENKVIVSSMQYVGQRVALLENIPANAVFVKFHFDDSGANGVNYALYEFFDTSQQVNPPSQTGVIMDGVTNYVQLPNMTMDSIEIDCLLDLVQSGAYYLFDGRTVEASGLTLYVYHGNKGAAILEVKQDETIIPTGVVGAMTRNVRGKIAIKLTQPFVFPTTLFKRYEGTETLKGILYGVKCYLNGQVVAEYDFTKENEKANQVLRGSKTWHLKQAKR